MANAGHFSLYQSIKFWRLCGVWR